MPEKLQKSEDPEFKTDGGNDDNFIKISGVIERKLEQCPNCKTYPRFEVFTD